MAQLAQTTRTRPNRPKPKPQPPFALIIENDDHHTYSYVIDLLQKVFGHANEKAATLTREIDRRGEALVWSGTMELGELKRDQIRGFGTDFYSATPVKFPLGVRLEPMAAP